jgi:hypothetical protein
MADVFLSYKREEREKVTTLAGILKRIGLDVWFDPELAPGDAYARIINDQLNSASAIVVCWSKDAVESDWVQAEAHKAHARGVYVSAKLEACEPPVPFNAFQDADLATWSGDFEHEGLASLISKLAALTRRPVKATYDKLAASEAEEIEGIIAEQKLAAGADDPEEDEPEASGTNPVTAKQRGAPTHLMQFLAQSPHIGARELSSALAQIAFEQEVLSAASTKWIVAQPDADAPRTHAKVVYSLEEALEAAAPGDCVVVLPGTYRGRFTVTKDIRLIGFGLKDLRPILSGDVQGATLELSGVARVENLIVDSRDNAHALRINGGSPQISRCLLERRQIAKGDDGCVYIRGGAEPAFLACTVWSQYAPGFYFATRARASVVASDVVSNEADAVSLQARAKPVFERCHVRANGGHAIVSNTRAQGAFNNCSVHAVDHDTIVNHDLAYSRFVANRISVKRGSLIELKDGGGGVFERNRFEPDPDTKRLELELAQEKRKVFKNQDIIKRRIPPPVALGAAHRARFAQNRFPDGTTYEPPSRLH